MGLEELLTLDFPTLYNLLQDMSIQELDELQANVIQKIRENREGIALTLKDSQNKRSKHEPD